MAASRKIGGMVVLRTETAERHGPRYFLLGFRHKKQAWELPGGKIEDEDDSIEAGTLRELREETGHTDSVVSFDFIDYVDTGDEYLVMVFEGLAVSPDIDVKGVQPNPERGNYREWRWFTVSELLAMTDKITWLSARVLERALEIEIPEEKCLPCPFKRKKVLS